jgi:hypothetical protein
MSNVGVDKTIDGPGIVKLACGGLLIIGVIIGVVGVSVGSSLGDAMQPLIVIAKVKKSMVMVRKFLDNLLVFI